MVFYNDLKETGKKNHSVSSCSDKYDKTETDWKYSSFESDKEDKMILETKQIMHKKMIPIKIQN